MIYVRIRKRDANIKGVAGCVPQLMPRVLHFE
jgi:hypothetical protein